MSDNQRNRRSRNRRGPRQGGGGQRDNRPNRPQQRTDRGLPQIEDLDALTQEQLVEKAKEAGITGAARFGKPRLITELLAKQNEGLDQVTGILEVRPDGYGFLRTNGYLPGPQDVYVARSQVQRIGLRTGDQVTGLARPPKHSSENYAALLQVEEVDGTKPDDLGERPIFDKLPTPSPNERLRLEWNPADPIGRILDLLAPIGKGQRGMIVAPPKAGKTTILRRIARAIITNHPEVKLFVLLVDERPEEAYDWVETVGDEASVVASTFDQPLADHLSVSELLLERAKRLVEGGRDVVILLDSLTRMARTYNQAQRTSGKTMSGGIDSGALEPPKRFFGAARNIKGAGSLTIVATCLVDTGSRMDEVIFEEFKGRGNMEVRLDRSLAEKRIFPAINVEGSGTRNEELITPSEELQGVRRLRRVLHSVDAAEAMEILIKNMTDHATNAEFLDRIAKVG
ncbi:MAG: transcription termination factor Rho [Actinomycetota bacterium]